MILRRERSSHPPDAQAITPASADRVHLARAPARALHTMSMPQVLIVEDEPEIGDMLTRYLEARGYACRWVPSAMEAERCLREGLPDIVLLDWMLPGRSGYDFARGLRSQPATRRLPIIMLTAREEEMDKVKALEVGADDYMTKPFSMVELAARIQALLRRSTPETSAPALEVEGLGIDRESRRVIALSKTIPMGPTEFELLYFFITHMERVYSRAQLIEYVWAANTIVEERTVDVHIRRLRKALEPTGHQRLIQTVRGTGYRMSTRE